MVFSGFSKRIIVGILSLLLLVCQTAIAAHGCVVSEPSPGVVAAGQPCHDIDGKTGNSAPRDLCRTHCVAEQTMPAAAKLAILAALDLPPLAFSPAQPYDAAGAAPAPPARLRHVSSPPRPIVHCRLLI